MPEQHRFAETFAEFEREVAGKAESRLMARYVTVVGTQLQAPLAGIGATQLAASRGVEAGQDDLQQAYLTGDQLNGLIEVRCTSKMPDQRQRSELGHGDDRNHQEHGASGKRIGEKSHGSALPALAASGTKT